MYVLNFWSYAALDLIFGNVVNESTIVRAFYNKCILRSDWSKTRDKAPGILDKYL